MTNDREQLRAVVLMNYGGPESLDEVQPFLQNIFSDPGLFSLPSWASPALPHLGRLAARLRAPKARQIYEQIGGRSPLNDWTKLQADALQTALAAKGNYSVSVVMRYAAPRARQVVQELQSQGVKHVTLVPLYPQYSTATTKSSVEDFEQAVKLEGADFLLSSTGSFHVHPAYVDAIAHDIAKTYEALPEEDRSTTPLLFSAHGLPMRVVNSGDPYPTQVRQSVDAITAKLLGLCESFISYQSRVGPVKWLQPNTEKVLRSLANKGARRVVVYPISFVSEHSETLYELDILFKGMAKEWGLELHRVPALNCAAGLIEALEDLVLRATKPDKTASVHATV